MGGLYSASLWELGAPVQDPAYQMELATIDRTPPPSNLAPAAPGPYSSPFCGWRLGTLAHGPRGENPSLLIPAGSAAAKKFVWTNVRAAREKANSKKLF